MALCSIYDNSTETSNAIGKLKAKAVNNTDSIIHETYTFT